MSGSDPVVPGSEIDADTASVEPTGKPETHAAEDVSFEQATADHEMGELD